MLNNQFLLPIASELVIDLFAGGGGASTGIEQAGCNVVPRVTGRKAKHGYSYTAEYRAWQTMRLRCCEPTNIAYKDYGARGITVCARWLDSVESFIADMGAKPSPAHELDREDNDKGYSPDNCRWVTRNINDRNRRSNRLIEHDGETLTLVEWSERSSIPADTINKRLAAGWDISKTLTTPARAKLANGQWRPQKFICTDCGNPTNGTRCRPCENKNRPKNQGDAVNAIRRAA